MKDAVTNQFVLDASVTLAWCFPEESTSRTEALLDLMASGANALAPAIWPFEVANALLSGERHKRVTIAQVTSMLRRISDLPITVEPIRTERTFDQVLSVARQEQLSEYDAAYLELAVRENLPLATLDQKLSRAAKNAGVVLIKF